MNTNANSAANAVTFDINSITKRRHGHAIFIRAADACRIIGISENTFSMWKARHAYVEDLRTHTFDTRPWYSLTDIRRLAKLYVPYARARHLEELEALKPAIKKTVKKEVARAEKKAQKRKPKQDVMKELLLSVKALTEQVQKLSSPPQPA